MAVTSISYNITVSRPKQLRQLDDSSADDEGQGDQVKECFNFTQNIFPRFVLPF